jgi:protein-tyrosine phosphatase
MTFSILIACTANVCRSPFAAAVLVHAVSLEEVHRRIAVDTGGIDAVPGQPVCPDVVRMGESRGLRSRALVGHQAQVLTADQIEAADLVLAADRRTRSGIMKRVSRAAGRTFTLREAAQLGEVAVFEVRGQTLEDRLRSYVAAMNAGRGLRDLPRTRHMVAVTSPWRRVAVHGHDIPDAHQGERAPHRVVYALTTSSAQQVARGLARCAHVSVG